LNIKFFTGPPGKVEDDVNRRLDDKKFLKIHHLQQSPAVVPVPITASPLALDAKIAGVELNALALISLIREEVS
jgi:hypothetical protein